MITIWKFVLGPPQQDGVCRIDTQKARILRPLSFGVEGNDIVCWAEVRPEESYFDMLHFQLANTGEPFEQQLQGSEFLATLRVGSIVWHIYGVKP